MVRMGKIVISVIATTGYNDEIFSSPDRRYKRFLLYVYSFYVFLMEIKACLQIDHTTLYQKQIRDTVISLESRYNES